MPFLLDSVPGRTVFFKLYDDWLDFLLRCSVMGPEDVMLPPHRQAHWTLTVFPRWQHLFSSVEQVLSLLESPSTVLQENSRGSVCLIQHNGYAFIAKRSKRQERNVWMQFTSLYRKGEGARALHNLARLYDLGLPVPQPVLVLEKIRWGCVVSSWSLYCYVDGEACTCADAAHIARLLKRIHQHGWVHRDPHVQNFLKHGEQLSVIDCARAKPWNWRYAQMYDLVLLNNCCPGSLQYYGVSAASPLYRLAKAHNNLVKCWRYIKRIIRPWAYHHRK